MQRADAKRGVFFEDDSGASKMTCFSEDDTRHAGLGVKIGKAKGRVSSVEGRNGSARTASAVRRGLADG